MERKDFEKSARGADCSSCSDPVWVCMGLFGNKEGAKMK